MHHSETPDWDFFVGCLAIIGILSLFVAAVRWSSTRAGISRRSRGRSRAQFEKAFRDRTKQFKELIQVYAKRPLPSLEDGEVGAYSDFITRTADGEERIQAEVLVLTAAIQTRIAARVEFMRAREQWRPQEAWTHLFAADEHLADAMVALGYKYKTLARPGIIRRERSVTMTLLGLYKPQPAPEPTTTAASAPPTGSSVGDLLGYLLPAAVLYLGGCLAAIVYSKDVRDTILDFVAHKSTWMALAAFVVPLFVFIKGPALYGRGNRIENGWWPLSRFGDKLHAPLMAGLMIEVLIHRQWLFERVDGVDNMNMVYGVLFIPATVFGFLCAAHRVQDKDTMEAHLAKKSTVPAG